ncbi:TetR/AcrR family transcriptional regulator [Pseudonocardia sp. C8]|uniref:TetR/AcrR family transcriptional regulator n=1 Tax=Pseudonocardia sp. C8 TaxID=2762759 RepID=UPI0016429256|nr:TetR/AcrR family transcriptional regulator [Pseudonocardia sp. C8]MBC3193612.1 TetR/AcrR family transcriptional regulator [Pseudonocardia sp. C8]
MTGSVNPVTAAPPAGDTARMERVLDAAGELLVRQGYRRVTIEDVARRAGVGKGTVYLHVRTKDALFLTVLLRAQRRMLADLADRILAEPAVALPWRMSRLMYERMLGDDVARVLYLGDVEVLGRLVHEAAETLGELAAQRNDVSRRYLRLLREAGLVADDLDVDEQVHSWAAVTYGFFVLGGLPQSGTFVPADSGRRGELIEHAVRRLLAGPAPESGAARVAAEVAALYRPLIDHIDTEWRRRVR